MLGDLAAALQGDKLFHDPEMGRFVVHCACGDRTDTAKTHRVVFHPSSSLLPCNEEVGLRLGHNMQAAEEAQQEYVPVLKLDDLAELYEIRHVDLLKIDVQGYESRVLRGAVEVLKDTDRVMVEIIEAPHYRGQSDPEEIRGLLRSAGFQFYMELNRDVFPDNGEVLEVDELWVVKTC
jgi:FkbM family methyltransferase